MMGMLNASQKRTHRAALTEALMSRQPDATSGCARRGQVARSTGGRWRRLYSLTTNSPSTQQRGTHLVADKGDSAAVHAAKANDNVLSVVRHDLEELTIVHHLGVQTQGKPAAMLA